MAPGDDEQDAAESLMMSLRHLCEDRQADHVHLTDTSKATGNAHEVRATTIYDMEVLFVNSFGKVYRCLTSVLTDRAEFFAEITRS